VQRCKRFQDKYVMRLLFWLGRARHGHVRTTI
jgi:hypothetical protein